MPGVIEGGMARKLRIEYPGAMYHVTARGNDGQKIFETVADRRHLLELLVEGVERYEVRLYAYVLMRRLRALTGSTLGGLRGHVSSGC